MMQPSVTFSNGLTGPGFSGTSAYERSSAERSQVEGEVDAAGADFRTLPERAATLSERQLRSLTHSES